MTQAIGAFQAKAQLSKLLRAVERGERFTITVRGKPVADLVPTASAASAATQEAIEALRAFPRVQGVSSAQVEEFVAAGRR